MSETIWIVAEHLRGQILDITYIMMAAGKQLAEKLGAELAVLLLGHGARDLARTLGVADRVVYVDHPALANFSPEAYEKAILAVLKDSPPRALLVGNTSVGMDIAAGLAKSLNAPLIAACRGLLLDEDPPKYESLICGGKLIAHGPLPDGACVLTMIPGGYKAEAGKGGKAPSIEEATAPDTLAELAVTHVDYIEPEVGDVDITKEGILVAVGRGLQNEENLPMAQELAAALGGQVAASRPIVDQGWLPTSRLVGKSGKIVAPHVYLALGISGAPEHVEGFMDAEYVIAVNTDEKAPIFDHARVGATVDMMELMPVLTEKIKQAKGA
jgi:electron transfer flavoprotein alpha subunit